MAAMTPSSMLSARNEPTFRQTDIPNFAINYDDAGEEEDNRQLHPLSQTNKRSKHVVIIDDLSQRFDDVDSDKEDRRSDASSRHLD